MLGQGADRDKIDAGLGEAADGLQGDVAGDLQLGPPGRDGDSVLHHGHLEVIQHDDIGLGLQGLLQLFQIFDLDLDPFPRIEFLCLGHRLGNATTGHDMVLFDEVGIK